MPILLVPHGSLVSSDVSSYRASGLVDSMKPQKKKNSARSVVKLAQELLKKDEAALEELRMHDFPDDESAHDDELTEQLYVEFSAEVEAPGRTQQGVRPAP